MAEFDRADPLFERNSVSFEIVAAGTQGGQNASGSSSSSRKHGNFTVRILQGHRPSKSGGERERVIRFEMSDECNLLEGPSIGEPAPGTPFRAPGNTQHRTPTIPIIHMPFMTADRGRVCPPTVQSRGNQQGFDPGNGLGFHPKPSGTMTNRPIELYELEVGESDFADLRRDQALLVDFNDFANSLISLLQLCELGDEGPSQPQGQNDFWKTGLESIHHGQHGQQPCDGSGGWNGQTGQHWSNHNSAWGTPLQQQPQEFHQQRQGMQFQGPRMASPHGKNPMPVSTYTCRLETNSSAPVDDGMQWRAAKSTNASMHARFSIMESNQFRELSHLALNLNVGTDKSVRLYLSSRLSQTMMQNKSIQSLHAEQQRRLEAAETDLVGLNRRLHELMQSSEAEKCQIRYQAEERLQTESGSQLAEMNEMKAAKDAEIKALNERSAKDRAVLENKVRALEDINAKINSEKTASENENERLATKLGYQETANKTLTNELDSLRSQLQRISHDKSATEKSLHQLQLQLSSLEYSNNDQEKAISQTEAKRISAERVSADAKQMLSRQQSQMEELRRRLEDAELETSKYKDLTSRYKADRLETKKSMKDKVEMIRETSDALAGREKETSELKQRVRELEKNLRQTQLDKESASRGLIEARQQMGDDKKKLENNQQVIAWLNKQVSKNASSVGAVWQGGNVASSTNAVSKALPTPAPAMANQAPPLSRFLPPSTPYQRSYITPEVKPVAGAAPQRLHPEPTPYSGRPRHPDATGR